MVKELFEGIVVEVNVECVHLVVCHEVYILVQEADGDELAAAVEHEAAHLIVGVVNDCTLWEFTAVLLGNLQQCTCCPNGTALCCRLNFHVVCNGNLVTLSTKLLVALD